MLAPIDALCSFISDAAVSNAVVPIIILEAPTGMGKSTDMVVQIMNRLNYTCTIFTPKISITKGVANFITTDYGGDTPLIFGKNVGYMTGESSIIPSETPHIKYATHPILDMIGAQLIDTPENVIFIDECHELSDSLSLAQVFHFLYCSNQLGFVCKRSVVVLMSATPNIQAMCKYFEIKPQSMNVMILSGIKYPIETILITNKRQSAGDELVSLLKKYKCRRIVLFDLSNQISRAVKLELIGKVVKVNRKALLNNPQLMSDYDNEEGIVIYNSTQVGQAGVTFKDADCVIDDGIIPVMSLLPYMGISMLIMTPANDATKIQRRGRTGRMCKGIYIQMEIDKFDQPNKTLDHTVVATDLTSAFSLNPSIYTLSSALYYAPQSMYQAPLAGVYEHVMHAMTNTHVLNMQRELVVMLNTLSVSLSLEIESLILLIHLANERFPFLYAAAIAAYYTYTTSGLNPILSVMSTIEREQSSDIMAFDSDIEYLIAMIFKDNYYATVMNLVQDTQATQLEQMLLDVMSSMSYINVAYQVIMPTSSMNKYEEYTLELSDMLHQVISDYIDSNYPARVLTLCGKGVDVMGMLHCICKVRPTDKKIKFLKAKIIWKFGKYEVVPTVFTRK